MDPRPPETRPWRASALAGLAAVTLAVADLALAGTGTSLAADWHPTSFHATYAVQWKGFNAGTSTLELRRTGVDTWTYVSRSNARGLFRIAIPDTVAQDSDLRFVAGQPQPLSFRADDGSDSTERDIALDFDWQRMRISGTAENQGVDLAMPPDILDPMTVQIAQMRAAAAGAGAVAFHTIDKNEVKEYDFTRHGTQTISTSLGELETVIYESRRRGSKRMIRLWMAPSLDYLPVRAERFRADKIEFAMAIRELRRDEAL